MGIFSFSESTVSLPVRPDVQPEQDCTDDDGAKQGCPPMLQEGAKSHHHPGRPGQFDVEAGEDREQARIDEEQQQRQKRYHQQQHDDRVQRRLANLQRDLPIPFEVFDHLLQRVVQLSGHFPGFHRGLVDLGKGVGVSRHRLGQRQAILRHRQMDVARDIPHLPRLELRRYVVERRQDGNTGLRRGKQILGESEDVLPADGAGRSRS